MKADAARYAKSTMSKEMSPNFLAYLDEERQFQETHQKNKVRRVKIEKVNQAWLVRFLPVGLGSRNLWYARMGQHWMNKQPIFCPRCVSPDFGGDPNADCPVCQIADVLNAEDNDEISTFGFKLRANLTYLTYCLVYQIDPGRGEVQEMPDSEIMKPWEFQHYKSSFDELMDYFRRGTTASRPYSVLDLEKGNDFWATRTTKGTRLDRQDPGPIFALDDPQYEAKLDQIFNQISQPKIKIPTQKELEVFARKAEAAAYGETDDRSERGRGRRVAEEDDEPQDRPSRRVSSAPGRRMAAAAAPAEEEPAGEPAGDDDQIPGAEVPARTVSRPAGRPGQAAAPARAAAAPVGRPAGAARPAPAAASRTAAPAAAAAPARRPATTAARPAPAAAAAATARRPAPAAAAPASTVTEEEDPGVAEEATDQAPPAEELPPEEGQEAPAEGAEQGGDQEEAPPSPATRQTHAAPAANAALRQRLIGRVRNV